MESLPNGPTTEHRTHRLWLNHPDALIHWATCSCGWQSAVALGAGGAAMIRWASSRHSAEAASSADAESSCGCHAQNPIRCTSMNCPLMSWTKIAHVSWRCFGCSSGNRLRA